MTTSFSARSGLMFAALLGIAILPGCGGGGSTTVPSTTPVLQAPPGNGSVPVSALDIMHPASTSPVNATGSVPAAPTSDINDRATISTASQFSAGSDFTAESQHFFAGSLHRQSTASARRSASNVAVNSPNDLSYHGGVVVGSAVSHNLFVNYPAATRQSLNFSPGRFLADLGNDQFITMLYQYLTSPGSLDSTPVTGRYTKGIGSDVTDTFQSPRPNSTNQYYGQLQILLAVRSAAIALGANGGSGYGHVYHVFLPKNVDTCFENPLGTPTSTCYSPDNGSTFVFCAYHGSFTSSGTLYLYTVEPYQDVPGCQNSVYNQGTLPQAVSPTVDPADPGYSTLSHELFETLSDPRGRSWYNNFSGGQENGDICAEFDNFVTVNGDKFVLQSEYSDIGHQCVSANLTSPSQTPQTAMRAAH